MRTSGSAVLFRVLKNGSPSQALRFSAVGWPGPRALVDRRED
jgi:hypothetical protein